MLDLLGNKLLTASTISPTVKHVVIIIAITFISCKTFEIEARKPHRLVSGHLRT